MEWRVSGADKTTGIDKVLLIEAENETEAVRQAGRQGLMVDGVRANVAMPRVKAISGLWLAILIVGPALAIAIVTYLMHPAKPALTPSSAATAPPVAAAIPTPRSRHGLPPTPQPFGSISGAAWMQRNGGDTALMRGLHVYLGKAFFADPSPVCRQAEAAIQSDQGFVKLEEESIASQIKDFGGDPSTDPVIANDKAKIEVYQRQIANLQAFIDGPIPNFPSLDAYRLLLRNSQVYRVGFPIESIAVMDAHANVDGRFALPNVPPGDYVLYAAFNTNSTGIDWLEPIHVDPGEAKTVDLSNDNAIHIYNAQ
jgi:hypothetical protein